MKRTILLCSSVFALALSAATVSAQDKGGSGGSSSGASGPSTNGASSAERAPSSGPASDGSKMDAPGKTGANSDMKKGSGPKAEQSSDKIESDSARSDTKSDGDGKKANRDSAKSENAKSEDTAKAGDDKDRSAASGKSDGAAGAGSPPKLSGEQRTKVQSSFRGYKEKSVRNLNISVSVGVAVPRSVTLYAVPEDVIVIAPEYRRYKYFVYEDEILIVDPATYEIVEVIVLA